MLARELLPLADATAFAEFSSSTVSTGFAAAAAAAATTTLWCSLLVAVEVSVLVHSCELHVVHGWYQAKRFSLWFAPATDGDERL